MQHVGRVLPDGSEAVYVWFEAMHTRVDMLLRGRAPLTSEGLLAVAAEVQTLLGHLERVGNKFDPESEISRLCAAGAGRKVELSEDLFEMLRLCKEYHRSTGGLFDITVGSESHTPSTIDSVQLESDGRRCTLGREGIRLDLSGFIKGYALDRIRPLLLERGIKDALVSLGNSSIMAMGDVPGPVKDSCLTTSGNSSATRRHIVNPLTGEYACGEGSVSVRTSSGAEGEVAAKKKFLDSRI